MRRSNEFNTLPEKYRFASILSIFAGYIFVGLENAVRWPKVTIPFFRFLFIYSVAVCGTYLFEQFWMLTIGSAKLSKGLMIYHGSQAMSVCVTIVKAMSVHLRRFKITSMLDIWYKNFLHKKDSPDRQKILARRLQFHLRMYSITLMIMLLPRLLIGPRTLYAKKAYVPTIMPGDRTTTTFVVIAAFYHACLTAFQGLLFIGFECVLCLLLIIVVVEAEVLAINLKNIFSMVAVDNEGKYVLDSQEDAGPSGAEEWQMQSRMELARIELKKWMEKYNILIGMVLEMKKWFRAAIVANYIYIILFSCGMILGDTKRNFSPLAIFNNAMGSISAALLLFATSYFGDCFKSNLRDIEKATLGTNWPHYPLDMKKNLSVILMMTQREHRVDAWGLYPLSLETFSSVIQMTYTLVTFTAGLPGK